MIEQIEKIRQEGNDYIIYYNGLVYEGEIISLYYDTLTDAFYDEDGELIDKLWLYDYISPSDEIVFKYRKDDMLIQKEHNLFIELFYEE